MPEGRAPANAVELLDDNWRSLADLYVSNNLAEHRDAAHALAHAVIGELLGWDWLDRLYSDKTRGTTYFQLDRTDEASRAKGRIRIITLAEMLLNLRCVPGIESRIKALQDDLAGVEGYATELEAAKLLLKAGLGVTFGVTTGPKGSNHDLAFELPDGTWVCCEAKCRIGVPELTRNAVRSPLNDAYDQLPSDECGMVFMNVPPRWVDADSSPALSRYTRGFFGTRTRVVSVFYYAVNYSPTRQNSFSNMNTREFVNEKSPYYDVYRGGLAELIAYGWGKPGWLSICPFCEEMRTEGR